MGPIIQLSVWALTEATLIISAGSWWEPVGSFLDYWGYRYQTLLAALIALAAASPVFLQLREMRRQSAAVAAQNYRVIAQDYQKVADEVDAYYNKISGFLFLSDMETVRQPLNGSATDDLSVAISDYQGEIIRAVTILRGSAGLGDAMAKSYRLATDALLRITEVHARGSDQTARRIAAHLAVQALKETITDLSHELALKHEAAWGKIRATETNFLGSI
jgi:hypothetical protein